MAAVCSASSLPRPSYSPRLRAWRALRWLAVGTALAALIACASTNAMDASVPGQPFGTRTRSSGCVTHDGLPDAACTPGAVFPRVTSDDVCKPGYSTSVRNVPSDVSRAVYAEYGIADHPGGSYEVDHLVPLEIGGSNDVANLWPEAAEPPPGFHQKDQVENYLHDQVCAGHLSLLDAQRMAASNWIGVYEQIPRTGATVAAPATSESGAVAIVSATGAAPGGQARATVQTTPGATCSLAYTTPAGTVSRASGLGARAADAAGSVSWTWDIAASTRPGTGTIVVTCDGASARSPITIG
jgi:hypothetical protein